MSETWTNRLSKDKKLSKCPWKFELIYYGILAFYQEIMDFRALKRANTLTERIRKLMNNSNRIDIS